MKKIFDLACAEHLFEIITSDNDPRVQRNHRSWYSVSSRFTMFSRFVFEKYGISSSKELKVLIENEKSRRSRMRPRPSEMKKEHPAMLTLCGFNEEEFFIISNPETLGLNMVDEIQKRYGTKISWSEMRVKTKIRENVAIVRTARYVDEFFGSSFHEEDIYCFEIPLTEEILRLFVPELRKSCLDVATRRYDEIREREREREIRNYVTVSIRNMKDLM